MILESSTIMLSHEYGIIIYMTGYKGMCLALDSMFRRIDFGRFHPSAKLSEYDFSITIESTDQKYIVSNNGDSAAFFYNSGKNEFYKRLYDRECLSYDFIREKGRLIKTPNKQTITRNLDSSYIYAHRILRESMVCDIVNLIFGDILTLIYNDRSAYTVVKDGNYNGNAIVFPL